MIDGHVKFCETHRQMTTKLATLTAALEVETLAKVMYAQTEDGANWEEDDEAEQYWWRTVAHAIRRHVGLEVGEEKP